MFKIDKSFVEDMNSNKSFIVTHRDHLNEKYEQADNHRIDGQFAEQMQTKHNDMLDCADSKARIIILGNEEDTLVV